MSGTGWAAPAGESATYMLTTQAIPRPPPRDRRPTRRVVHFRRCRGDAEAGVTAELVITKPDLTGPVRGAARLRLRPLRRRRFPSRGAHALLAPAATP